MNQMLAKSVAKQTQRSPRDLKNVARFLLGTKHMALYLLRQKFPECISTYVDSDLGGCRLTRRSTTGMVQMIGGDAVKHTSNLQGGTGLNVSECECCGLAHGAAHHLGLRSCMADLEFEMSLEVLSDSSAASAFASRRGLGRQNLCKNDIRGFRNEWQQDISQYKRSKQRTMLRLESIGHSHPMLTTTLSLDQVQQFSCDKLAKSKKGTISRK